MQYTKDFRNKNFFFNYILLYLPKPHNIMATKTSLTLAERIDRARAKTGSTQSWIISQMIDMGHKEMNDVKFSRKKLGFDDFTPDELTALSEILKTDLSK